MKTVQIILASTRKGPSGEAVAKWVVRSLHEKSSFRAELVDLLDYPLPMLDSNLAPISGKSATELITAWSMTIAKADGYIIIAPE